MSNWYWILAACISLGIGWIQFDNSLYSPTRYRIQRFISGALLTFCVIAAVTALVLLGVKG